MTVKEAKVKVLMVCMGNICRSPTAHGVFEHIVKQHELSERIEVDSAGTHAYHIGESPDPRSCEVAKQRGIDLSDLRARKAIAEDFDRFDYVLAMDRDNFRILNDMCPMEHKDKLYLFLDFAPQLKPQREVPDPYYGGPRGFDQVFDMVEQASEGLLEDIQKRFLA